MDYQEWKKRDGRVLILCNLNKLLLDYYNVDSLAQISDKVSASGEYAIQCPFCKEEGYLKEKLYIREDLAVGNCFKCHRAFINVTDEIEYDIKVPRFGRNNVFNLIKLNDRNWTLDMYFNEFDDYDEKGYKYLMSRHQFMDPMYKMLHFKFYNHNIVMPFYFHGEFIYYQIRFTNNNPIRYYFPPIPKKPIYSIEFTGSRDLIICEGVMDAIGCQLMYPDRTPIAVLGSSVSDYQIEMIRTYNPRSILVYMDKTELSIGVIRKMKSIINNVEYNIRWSDGRDPEEELKDWIKYNYYGYRNLNFQ